MSKTTFTKADMKALKTAMGRALKLATKYAKSLGREIPKEVRRG